MTQLTLIFLGFLGLLVLVILVVLPKSSQGVYYRAIWFISGIAAFCYAAFMYANARHLYPTESMRRAVQQQTVKQAVATNGGWAAMSAAARELDSNHHRGWYGVSTSRVVDVFDDLCKENESDRSVRPLPAPMAAIRPGSIEIYHRTESLSNLTIVKVRIFGCPPYTPFYGLEFVFGKEAESYVPRMHDIGALGNRYSHFNKITNGVFEIY